MRRASASGTSRGDAWSSARIPRLKSAHSRAPVPLESMRASSLGHCTPPTAYADAWSRCFMVSSARLFHRRGRQGGPPGGGLVPGLAVGEPRRLTLAAALGGAPNSLSSGADMNHLNSSTLMTPLSLRSTNWNTWYSSASLTDPGSTRPYFRTPARNSSHSSVPLLLASRARNNVAMSRRPSGVEPLAASRRRRRMLATCVGWNRRSGLTRDGDGMAAAPASPWACASACVAGGCASAAAASLGSGSSSTAVNRRLWARKAWPRVGSSSPALWSA